MLPPPPLLRAAGAYFEPLVAAIVVRRLQSRTLAALRDALLPKLISGELRVTEAERLIGAST